MINIKSNDKLYITAFFENIIKKIINKRKGDLTWQFM